MIQLQTNSLNICTTSDIDEDDLTDNKQSH
jgi:hypothetical protein